MNLHLRRVLSWDVCVVHIKETQLSARHEADMLLLNMLHQSGWTDEQGFPGIPQRSTSGEIFVLLLFESWDEDERLRPSEGGIWLQLLQTGWWENTPKCKHFCCLTEFQPTSILDASKSEGIDFLFLRSCLHDLIYSSNVLELKIGRLFTSFHLVLKWLLDLDMKGSILWCFLS